MATAGMIGHTTVLKWNVTDVAEVTRLGGVSISVSKVDSTSLGIANFYKEFLPGLLDPGDTEIEGIFDPSNTNGQIALLTDMNSRTSRAFTITFPTALATTWTGTAYVTAFATGEVTSEGMLTFSATLGIVGIPSLNITRSAGMTALTGTESVGPALNIDPTVAVGTYNYTADAINTGSTSIALSPVGALMTFDITCLGVTHNVVTGGTTGAIIISVADTVTPVYIKCYATAGGEVARNYTLWISRL